MHPAAPCLPCRFLCCLCQPDERTTLLTPRPSGLTRCLSPRAATSCAALPPHKAMQVQPRLVPPGHTTLSQTLQEGRTPERFNFWGYSTAAFFAPMARYSSAVAQGAPGQAAGHELKLLVRECHARGMEVIMDVVFNHTAEGNQQGPSISLRLPPGSCLVAGFADCAVRAPGLRASCGAAGLPRSSLSGCACLQTRPSLLHARCLEGHAAPGASAADRQAGHRGMDNRMFYMLAPGGEYYNYSGCGNTVNCNHPLVRRFLLDCLRYWVSEYHVDGFRCGSQDAVRHVPAQSNVDDLSRACLLSSIAWNMLGAAAGCELCSAAVYAASHPVTHID